MGSIQHQTAGRWRISNDELPVQFRQQQDCRRQSLPESLGGGYTDIFQLDHDLSYMETDYATTKDLAVLSKVSREESWLTVTLGLKGYSMFSDSRGDEVVFKEGYTTITAFNSSQGERQYQANKAIKQLRFSMSKSCLERYFGANSLPSLFNNSGIHLVSCRPISPQGLGAAQQLLTNTMPQEVRRLFMQGQAMSLLAVELSHLWSRQPETPVRFTEKDRGLAMAAQDILVCEFKNPPSVETLSKRVGTNQFKLKQLFHHFFNNTVYGLLLDIRMNNAYRLLESSHCHVSVAADFVGYSHASNFSTAFIKYFGISPKAIFKKH